MKSIKTNKKGISNIVASVFLIALTVIAVSLLSATISKTINLSPQMSCLDLKLNPPVQIEKACLDSTLTTRLFLKAKSSSDIGSLEVITNNARYLIGEGCGICKLPKEGETKLYPLSEQASLVSIKINDCIIETKPVTSC